MKKLLFLFALLASVTTSATVTVTPLSVNYNTRQVTFRVAWTGTTANNQVWVWVDLCPVAGTSPGTFAKANISAATGSGFVAGTLNGRGFFVNANGATVTATLSNATGQFNWCAYGSDFPPNAVDNGSSYTLKGSPPFIVTTDSGTFQVSTKTYSGSTITALTDATGCPGVLCGKNGQSAGLLNCCATGTTNCSGTCTTTSTYTTNDGACTDECFKAYTQLRNQCGEVINAKLNQYENTACRNGCGQIGNCALCYPKWPNCMTNHSWCPNYCKGINKIYQAYCWGDAGGECVCGDP
jgi:hypothetical protein